MTSPASSKTDSALIEKHIQLAVAVLAKHGRYSLSILQRRLRMSYSQACDLADELEHRGLVGPAAGLADMNCGSRELLFVKSLDAGNKSEGK